MSTKERYLLRRAIQEGERRKNLPPSEDPKRDYLAWRDYVESAFDETVGPDHRFAIEFMAVNNAGVLDSIHSWEDQQQQARELIERDISLFQRLISQA
jgi:hypothetical protein